MAYDGKLLRRAMDRYERDKQGRAANFEERRAAVYARLPRVEEIDRELRSTMSRIIASALRRGTDPVPAVRRLRDENLSLQEEKRRLLESHGFDPELLEEKPNCPLCQDTGYRGAEMCRCLRTYYAREQMAELSQLLDLGTQSFETFSLDWYSEEEWSGMGISPRENMEGVYRFCRRYAENFSKRSENLLLTGAPGLGKTFLSAAMARDISESGFSVVYDTAAHIFALFEAQKFGREEEDAAAGVTRALSCDLLILDDLGTELTTAFTQSALYQIVNDRLMTGRKTIISTNLSSADIGKKYSAQLRSRIDGEYRMLHFFGEDIRLLKKNKK